MPRITITSIEFRNFKALGYFHVKLQHMNVLVGPNNSGKSTILSALRCLAEAMRHGRSKMPERVVGPEGKQSLGYKIPLESLPISLENIHTDYADTETWIRFRLSNGNHLALFFPADGGCILLPQPEHRAVSSPSSFRKEFPITIGVVPVLGPVEEIEEILTEETVRKGLQTHRASRHFRNYWRYFREGFEDFAELVAKTWQGMSIDPPERQDLMSGRLVMFCNEGRIPREIAWSGFGFQIWCQILTHISRAADASILVIDEPEIYLHPDVQRQLLGILRDAGPDIVIATHSTEIMGEADYSEILLINKGKQSAQRLRDIDSVQAAMKAIGSLQNITLTQLARTQKILFVEGHYDFKIVRKFARRLGFAELASGVDLTPVESEGFSSWEKIKATAWGIPKALNTPLKIVALFDRDYYCQEFISFVICELNSCIQFCHVHCRKEIENYLLVPQVLQRAFDNAIVDKNHKGDITCSVSDLLDNITTHMKLEVQAQYVAKRNDHLKNSGKDPSTITLETTRWFEDLWRNLETRMRIVPGKEVLAALRDQLQKDYGITLTDARIINEFKKDEVPQDLADLIGKLEEYRSQCTSD
nr:AAA family ATPase [Geobacter sulfurreducens]